jgi:precorrin-6B methylase 1
MAVVANDIIVLGLPADGAPLPPVYNRLIAKADLLVGGTRHLDRFSNFRGENY